MKPTLVLVGRPNVGKSTLFNRLTKTRDALVADMPGLTRDRHCGHGRLGNKPFRRAEAAIAEADVVLFLVDARAGFTPQDQVIADLLRRSGRPLHLLVNKAEGMDRAVVAAEFHELGLGEPRVISGAHGEGVRELRHRPQPGGDLLAADGFLSWRRHV